MQAVLMAGGKGTRLRALTHDEIPKPMVPVGGKPILQHQIEMLHSQGISEFIIIIGHLGEKIQEYFQDGSTYGVQIRYIKEEVPLGTAGALSLLSPFLTDNCFFLAFGDIIFDIDLLRMKRFHDEHKALATLFVHPNSHPYDSDLVVFGQDGRLLRFDSKNNKRDYWYQNCVNAGLYIMDSEICQYVPRPEKTDLEKQLLTALLEEGKNIFCYRSSEYAKDVGTPERIAATANDIKAGYPAARNLSRPQKAIFLDRDGTINRKNGLIYRDDQFELEPCAVEAIHRINQSGYLAIVVTNQPVVARGLCDPEDVETIHSKMETLLGQEGTFLDAIYFCPHHPDKGYPEENPAYKITCHCRKPDVGMLENAAEQYHIDLSNSWVIGDSSVDIQTGVNAGMHTALVLTGDAGKDGKYPINPDVVAEDLLDAVNTIVSGGVL